MLEASQTHWLSRGLERAWGMCPGVRLGLTGGCRTKESGALRGTKKGEFEQIKDGEMLTPAPTKKGQRPGPWELLSKLDKEQWGQAAS